jgi:hypothetical protein
MLRPWGLRYPVETILELLSSGMTTAEILADYARISNESAYWRLWSSHRVRQAGWDWR